MTRTIKKFLWALLTIGATLSAGFLSLTGMLAIFPHLLWGAGIVFVLAVAYESQVNGEGIGQAFERMFNPNYLSLGLIRHRLNSKIKMLGNNLKDNLFLEQYAKQKKNMEELEKYIESCENDIHYYREEYGLLKLLRFGRRSIEANEAEEKLKIAKNNLKMAMQDLQAVKTRLHAMELFFLKQLRTPTAKDDRTEMEAHAQCALSGEEKKSLLKEMRHKAFVIRWITWILTIAAGVCSGLVTLSLMQAGVAAISILGSTPIGFLVVLATLAGAGYTFLMYQNISDMIQKMNGKWETYFKRRIDKDGKEESRARCYFRRGCTVLVIACGIFATVATAGTWWPYARDGVVILGNIFKKVASGIRTATIVLMGIPTLIYYTQNSLTSVDAASRINFAGWWDNIKKKFNGVCKKASDNVGRFLNIPLFCEKLISSVAESVFFIFHVVTMGLMSDGLKGVPAEVTITTGVVLEVGTEVPYLPGVKPEEEDEEHHHNHTSLFLKILFLPIKVTSVVLKSCAVIWDYVFSGCKDFKESCRIIFDHKEGVTKKIASLPQLEEVSVKWDKQEKMEVCDQQIKRLESVNKKIATKKNNNIATRKVEVLNEIKTTLKTAQTKLTEDDFREKFFELERKRYNQGLFFKQSPARSAQEVRKVFSGESFKIKTAQ